MPGIVGWPGTTGQFDGPTLFLTGADSSYVKAEDRATQAPSRNEPSQLPRIAKTLAELRGWSLQDTAARTSANVHAALPRLASLP